MSNHLINETSPYLLQHVNNPVDWYPWGEEAFVRAKQEDKPVFLSVGYSTCHWCHVMAHESFEDEQVATLLNQYFISIKVDKEERPDVDSVYMSVCQALTGSGGWPMTIFMTPEQKPFFAGTYFPKTARYGTIGFVELLETVAQRWKMDREALIASADEIVKWVSDEPSKKNEENKEESKEKEKYKEKSKEKEKYKEESKEKNKEYKEKSKEKNKEYKENETSGEKASQEVDGICKMLSSEFLRGEAEPRIISLAVQIYRKTFDAECGGFGSAPKFPAAHNLLFLMRYYERNQGAENYVGNASANACEGEAVLKMVEKTLLQMYRGGMFDHIGGGFSRYSTDRYFLVPHFEKMLYDNAWLIMAYSKAYQLTANVLYRGVAEKTADYILREMTAREGGFYSAQDADSEGVEGKYYVFEPIEIMNVLGRDIGRNFCKYFDITGEGNFEGKSIPNLLKNNHISAKYNEYFPELYEYRKKRCYLHLDDKLLTGWNGLMIAAMCRLYRVTGKAKYLEAAKQAQAFVANNLYERNLHGAAFHAVEDQAAGFYEQVNLYVSYRNGKRSGRGFLDDYANVIFALLALYEATFDKCYLMQAKGFCSKVMKEFWDERCGGFFLSGKENEVLFMRSKETYDGAMPSGNSMMAYNLVQLYYLTGDSCYEEWAKKQLEFMHREAERYPAGYAMSLLALQDFMDMPNKVTIVLGDEKDMSAMLFGAEDKSRKECYRDRKRALEGFACKLPLDTIVRVLEEPTEEYPLKNGKTTYYVCKGRVCYPGMNELEWV